MSRLPALRRAAVREWGPLVTAVRRGLAGRGVRALALTTGAVALTATVQLTQNQAWGYRPVQYLGAVRAEDPLWLALLRTPLSLFVPALDLPVWGALAQILLVFGVAEVCLGRWRTLAVAYLATLAGTLYARIGIALGPEGFSGCPPPTRRWWTPALRRRSWGSRCTSAISGGPGSPGRWWSSRWWWRSSSRTTWRAASIWPPSPPSWWCAAYGSGAGGGAFRIWARAAAGRGPGRRR